MERERHAIISTCTKENNICITESKNRETNLECKTDLNGWLDLHIFCACIYVISHGNLQGLSKGLVLPSLCRRW